MDNYNVNKSTKKSSNKNENHNSKKHIGNKSKKKTINIKTNHVVMEHKEISPTSESMLKKKRANEFEELTLPKKKDLVIVKLKNFIYLREFDYILAIVVENHFQDYKTNKKYKLDDYLVGIQIDDGFIPKQTFLKLYNNKSVKIIKRKYNGEYPKYPIINKKNYFRFSNVNGIEPQYLVAIVKKVDDDKKYIDLSIKKLYKIILN